MVGNRVLDSERVTRKDVADGFPLEVEIRRIYERLSTETQLLHFAQYLLTSLFTIDNGDGGPQQGSLHISKWGTDPCYRSPEIAKRATTVHRVGHLSEQQINLGYTGSDVNARDAERRRPGKRTSTREGDFPSVT